MGQPSSSLPERLDRGLLWVEELFRGGVLVVMVGLALTSLVLRWGGTGVAWIDPVLRYSVLWIALLGSLQATRTRSHIQIDAFSRLLPPAGQRILGRVLGIFSAGVCGVVSCTSWRFVVDERSFGTEAFGGLPVWIPEMILPVGFALLSFRFLLSLFLPPPPAEVSP